MDADEVRAAKMFAQRGFYLDVFACGVLVTSKNVPEAPREPANAGPSAGGRSDLRRAVAEHATQRSGRGAAGKTCCAQSLGVNHEVLNLPLIGFRRSFPSDFLISAAL